MNKKGKFYVLFGRFIVMVMAISLMASSALWSEEALDKPEKVVSRLYDLVTFTAGTTPDWKAVKSLFIDEAVIVLRTSRTDSTVFSLDGFVNDFIKFIENSKVKTTGFSEKILRMKPWIFKDIAHILVLYEASIPDSARPPQKGVDSIQLIKRAGRWHITAITNEIPTPQHPVPEILK